MEQLRRLESTSRAIRDPLELRAQDVPAAPIEVAECRFSCSLRRRYGTSTWNGDVKALTVVVAAGAPLVSSDAQVERRRGMAASDLICLAHVPLPGTGRFQGIVALDWPFRGEVSVTPNAFVMTQRSWADLSFEKK
jgi:hypothetical protein